MVNEFYQGRLDAEVTSGDIQLAIWTLIGAIEDNEAAAIAVEGTVGDYSYARVQDLITSANANGDGYVAGAEDYQLTLAVDTFGGGFSQPLAIITKGAQLGDTVWFDADQNGIQDGRESGIQGATVELYRNVYTYESEIIFQDLNGDGDVRGDGERILQDFNGDGDYSDGRYAFTGTQLVGSTITDANGYYDFRGLSAGVEYFVQFTTPTEITTTIRW